jgi:hypothetical protein
MNKFNVYQHWDPLKICVVGRSYPPEFYSWITEPHVRSLFEKIALETEEDYQGIIKKLQEFGVEVLRPNLPDDDARFISGRFMPPPMTPRDYFVMIGDTFYDRYSLNFKQFYQDVKAPHWPDCNNIEEITNLPRMVQKELYNLHELDRYTRNYAVYDHVRDRVQQQGNVIKNHVHQWINGAGVSRIGRDLYFSTAQYGEDTTEFKKLAQTEFPNTRNHVIDTGGHGDGVYCPVTPGLIFSVKEYGPDYNDTFPGWEVINLPTQSWHAVKPFMELKIQNRGKWWIPGFEQDQAVVDVVESWLGHWTGYVEETVFDVNMLIIDPKNVMVFNYNKTVFDALERYGITPHVTPFRHRYFWDGGIHCVTCDIHREGVQQDYFPGRT